MPLIEDEWSSFCAANELLRVEQEPDGELVIKSPTGTEGSGAETDIAIDLVIWARQEGRGRACNSNAGFRLPDGPMRAADAAWVSWPRLNALTPQQRRGFAPLCPEFVIEVRSATDRVEAVRDKMQHWMANGAELAWLIDPERKMIEVYRPGRGPKILEGGSCVEGEGPVAGFVLELARIWV